MTFETNDNYSIPFKISNNSSTIRLDSIQNEKKNTIRTSLTVTRCKCWHSFGRPTGVCRWSRHCSVGIEPMHTTINIAVNFAISMIDDWLIDWAHNCWLWDLSTWDFIRGSQWDLLEITGDRLMCRVGCQLENLEKSRGIWHWSGKCLGDYEKWGKLWFACG